MRLHLPRFLFALLLLCAFAVPHAFAQPKIALGPQISTLGVGVSVNARVVPVLSISGEYNLAPLSTYERSGFDTILSVEPSVQGAVLMGHIHPGGGRFAIGGGVVIGGVDADGTFSFNSEDSVELNGVSYIGNDVGDIQLEFNYGSVAPVVTVGWVGRGFNFLFGASIVAPTLDTSATGPLGSNAQFQQNLDAEFEDFTDTLDQVPVFPYIRLGWQFGSR